MNRGDAVAATGIFRGRESRPRRGHSVETGARLRYRAFLTPNKDVARFWAVSLAFAGPVGVYGGWGAVLAPSLKSAGISEATAGWLGFYMTLAGCVGGVAAGSAVDRVRGRMKAFVLAFYAIATLAFLAFAFAVASPLVPPAPAYVMTAGVIGGLCVNAPIPLLFELALETAHGALDAGAAAMVLVLAVTAVQVVFLGVSFSGGGGTAWMMWFMALSIPASAAPLLFMRARYPRLVMDGDDRLVVGWLDRKGFF